MPHKTSPDSLNKGKSPKISQTGWTFTPSFARSPYNTEGNQDTNKANTIRKVSFWPLLVVTPQTYCLKFRITWVYMICQGKIKHFNLLKDVPFLYVSLTVSLLCPKRATFCIIDRRTEVPCDKGTAKATPFKTLCSWPIGLTGERRFSTLPQQDATSETTTEIRRKNLWGSRALDSVYTRGGDCDRMELS